jgi:hypothetical protein
MNIRDAATSFEAVKLGLSQDKNGLVLKLSIHPNDMPKDVMTDSLGSRYMVAIVRLDEQDQPKQSEEKSETERLLSRTYALCRNERFGRFLEDRGLMLGNRNGRERKDFDPLSESDIRESLLKYTGLAHRSELKSSENARAVLQKLYAEFDQAVRSGHVQKKPLTPTYEADRTYKKL